MNKNLIALDLSFCSMVPKQLNNLLRVMSESSFNLRSINLSYNMLNQESENIKFAEKPGECHECTDAHSFFENFEVFTKLSKYLSHINFSGMALKPDQLFKLFEILQNCKCLCALHLDDNGITKDEKLFYDCL